jgi:hypothetical protein
VLSGVVLGQERVIGTDVGGEIERPRPVAGHPRLNPKARKWPRQ